MEPTQEQADIIAAFRTTIDNICVNALAGTGKTTTIEMICRAVTGIPILYLAFNKRVAEEATKRLPSHVEVRTFNALGHRVWSQAINKRLVVDGNKLHKLLRIQIDELPRADRAEAFETLAETLSLCRAAKREGWLPQAWRGIGKPLVGVEWFESQDEVPMTQQIRLIAATIDASIKAAYAGEIDYDDQLYMPVMFGGTWPRFPLVLVDEAQDMSPINHVMIERLVGKRLGIVGDPFQSIYAFRGSVSNGMTLLCDKYHMREFPLSLTYRVPKLGVERAWFRVPRYRAHESLIDGKVEMLDEWSSDDIPDGAAIICRNNAPLFTTALRLLRAGRGIKLVGMDIGAGLTRVMKKLGPPSLEGTTLASALETWLRQEQKKMRSEAAMWEKYECLQVLCFHPSAKNLGDAIRFAEDLFKRSGPIQLLSGHKAKGLEWDVVFHLDPWRIPSKFTKPDSEEWEQELNVRYVIETRFKRELFLVEMENFNG